MMRLAKELVIAVFLLALPIGIAHAGGLVNGSFETGDYSGWQLAEGAPPDWGTWGIVRNNSTINQNDSIYDFCDGLLVQEISSGLPHTYATTDGEFMAIQLQVGGQDHRLFQDIDLPSNASALSWDMYYNNHAGFFAADQYLAVHVRDLQDNILETLFMTDGTSAAQISMSSFEFDISQYAGQTVRIDVEMKVHQHFFDAGFDNFQIKLAETAGGGEENANSSLAPPGWSRSKGKKGGWDGPPGLNKNSKVPSGFEKGEKTGWKK